MGCRWRSRSAIRGYGLTDEIRERLFLPFYSTKQRGTGLGLSIAAKIAQEHHGSIRAEANLPQGARFLLTLPVMEQRCEWQDCGSGLMRLSNERCYFHRFHG
jgi:signal transduction histidine kinase